MRACVCLNFFHISYFKSSFDILSYFPYEAFMHGMRTILNLIMKLRIETRAKTIIHSCIHRSTQKQPFFINFDDKRNRSSGSVTITSLNKSVDKIDLVNTSVQLLQKPFFAIFKWKHWKQFKIDLCIDSFPLNKILIEIVHCDLWNEYKWREKNDEELILFHLSVMSFYCNT